MKSHEMEGEFFARSPLGPRGPPAPLRARLFQLSQAHLQQRVARVAGHFLRRSCSRMTGMTVTIDTNSLRTGKSSFFMGKSTISMVIFYSKL